MLVTTRGDHNHLGHKERQASYTEYKANTQHPLTTEQYLCEQIKEQLDIILTHSNSTANQNAHTITVKKHWYYNIEKI